MVVSWSTLLFCISNILLSAAVTDISSGSASIFKSLPAETASSSFARSGAMNCTLDAFALKFRSEFLRLRSSSFLSHSVCLVTSPSCSVTLPERLTFICSGAAVMSFLLRLPKSFSNTCPPCAKTGIGRSELPRQREISTASSNSSGLCIFVSAKAFASSKLMLLPATNAVHSTRHIWSIPFAMRFEIRLTSSSVQFAKLWSSSHTPAKAWLSVKSISGFNPAASRHDA